MQVVHDFEKPCKTRENHDQRRDKAKHYELIAEYNDIFTKMSSPSSTLPLKTNPAIAPSFRPEWKPRYLVLRRSNFFWSFLLQTAYQTVYFLLLLHFIWSYGVCAELLSLKRGVRTQNWQLWVTERTFVRSTHPNNDL